MQQEIIESTESSYDEKESAIGDFHKIKKNYVVLDLYFFKITKKKFLSDEDFHKILNNTKKILGFYYGKHTDMLSRTYHPPVLDEINEFLKTFKNKDLIELIKETKNDHTN